MEFTYTIRDDVVWSDGEPLDANDVAFTLNLYKSNHAYLPQNYLTLIDGDVEVVDDYTVRWRTKEPTACTRASPRTCTTTSSRSTSSRTSRSRSSTRTCRTSRAARS